VNSRFKKVTLAATAVAVGVGVFGMGSLASAAATDPVVSKLNVTKGSTAGGTVVVISGKNFSNVTGATGVKFGANNATSYLVLSATQIAAVAPAGPNGTVQVIVNNGAPSADVAADNFTYLAPIDAKAAANTLISPKGGTVISVDADTTAPGSIDFGANPAAFTANKVTATVAGKPAPVTYVDNNTVTLKTPAGTPSNVAVAVKFFHDGAAGAADSTNVKYASLITSMSKTSGPLAGSGNLKITISGVGLAGATTWKFGTTAATCDQTGLTGAKMDTTWYCKVPAAAVAGPVSVNYAAAAGPQGLTVGATYTYSDLG
jgi:hypothetical protein